MKKIFAPLLLIILLLSCSEENPDLVNPPSIANTINIRFINLGGTFENRTLEMIENTIIENVAYNSSSPTVNPPADSTTFKIFQGNNLEYSYDNVYKFRIRDVNYTFFALPSFDNSNNYQNVDTLLNFRTALTVPQSSDECLVRFFNAMPDSLASYSLRIGCPNGELVAPFMRYGTVMAQAKVVKSGEVAFSLVKAVGGTTEIINLYGSELEPQGQYTFILAKGADGKEKLMFLDENNLDADAYREAPVITERLANIRTINLTDANIDIAKITGEAITADLPDNYIDLYSGTPTCSSEEPDSLIVSNSFGSDTLITSLEVLEDYSIVAFKAQKGLKSVLVKPVPNTLLDDGKATIRVVHGAENYEGITVSLGARNAPQSSTNARNFIIGELLATKLNYGEISTQEYLEPHNQGQKFQIPLTIFTSTEPANLIYSSLVEIEPDKEYIVVFSQDNFGNPKTHLIEHSEENKIPNELNQGTMVQILNAVPGLEEMNVHLGNGLLDNAKIDFSSSLATVLPAGDQIIDINGVAYSLQSNPDLRPLVIAAGNSSAIDIFALNNPPMGAVYGEYKRNFVNASEEIAKLGIKETDVDSIPPSFIVDYRLSSGVETLKLDNKQAFFFQNYETGEEIFQLGDINPSFAKNYFYIFAGKKEVGDGYTVIIMQEF